MTERANLSWRRILAKCGPLFLARDSYGRNRIARIAGLAEAIRDYVLRSISSEEGDVDPDAAVEFLQRLPDVFRRCDEDIYDAPFAAEAYAFVHLLERYRRFLDVLEELLRAGELPVRDTALDVLDIGTGPAPALYAINDFFKELHAFATENSDCGRLAAPAPRLRSVESSMGMARLVHNLSEFTGRPGPFQPDRAEFEGFNPPRTRAERRVRLIEDLINAWDYSEQEARIQAHLEQTEWQTIGRYHICIFSNFLTTPNQVLNLTPELNQVFRALKPRGIVIVVGGSRAHYPLVYRSLDDIARHSGVLRLKHIPSTIPCSYDSPDANVIKRLYCSVFDCVRRVLPIDDLVRELPQDLWDPVTPLHGPSAFSIRVYRAPDRPRGVRFTKRAAAGTPEGDARLVGSRP